MDNLTMEKESFIVQYRGTIIHLAVKIETQMEEIIAFHYCGESMQKRLEFIHSILTKEYFTLEKKYITIGFICRNHYNDFFTEHEKGYKMIKDLIDIRNECAHIKFFPNRDINDLTKSESLFFQKYTTDKHKQVIQQIEINKDKANTNIRNFVIAGGFLHDMEKLIGLVR